VAGARKRKQEVPPAELRAERVLLLLAQLGQHLSAALEQVTDDVPSGNAPTIVLCQLDLEGPLRPGRLMEATGLTSGGVTKVLDRLEHKGLVRREYGVLEDDHRAVVVTLTEEGRAAVRAYARVTLDSLDEARVTVKEIDALLDGR
jgi:DNA-binding MarR family transcriptional regulator